MGWSIGYDRNWGRDIGYGVPAVCDFPGCDAKIDRGLGYVYGGEPYGGDVGCGLYFCGKHGGGQRCCDSSHDCIEPKADVTEWIEHKLRHESWAEWRAANPLLVEAMEKTLRERGGA